MMNQTKLEKLLLRNYKNLIIPEAGLALKNLNIFVGPNGCGKSNLIGTLKFLKSATLLSTSDAAISPLDNALMELGNDRILNLKLSPPQKLQMKFQIACVDSEPNDILLDLEFLVRGENNKILVEKDILSAARPSPTKAFTRPYC